jgi:uncharacterized membrane protein YfcA
MDFVSAGAGFLVGVLVGATGVGGGSLMTPLLVLGIGVSPAVAVGTDLLYASITKIGGAWAHGRRGTVDWRVCGLLAAGSIPAALATLVLLRGLAVDAHRYAALITGSLGVALILTAAALLFKEELRRVALRHKAAQIDQRDRSATRTIATGAVLGVLVTVSSVGAGALGVAALFFLYPGLAAVRIVGTDIAHAVPLTAVAGLGHASMGSVDWSLLGSLLVGSLPGVFLGSTLSRKLPERLLRTVLAAMLVLIGGRLVT